MVADTDEMALAKAEIVTALSGAVAVRVATPVTEEE